MKIIYRCIFCVSLLLLPLTTEAKLIDVLFNDTLIVDSTTLSRFSPRSSVDGKIFVSYQKNSDSVYILRVEERDEVHPNFFTINLDSIDSIALKFGYYDKGAYYSVDAVFDFTSVQSFCKYKYQTNKFKKSWQLFNEIDCVLFFGDLWYRYTQVENSISSDRQINTSSEFEVIMVLYHNSSKEYCSFSNDDTKFFLTPSTPYGDFVKPRTQSK